MSDKTPLIGLSSVPRKEFGHHGKEKYLSETGAISHRIGVKNLGCRVMHVKPGNKAFPFHCHHTNDEIAYIIEGSGTLRFGSSCFTISGGDIIGFPAGGPETAHQIINTSKTDLIYLVISTQNPCEIIEYPDSSKFGVIAGKAALQPQAASFEFFGRRQGGEADFWDGE